MVLLSHPTGNQNVRAVLNGLQSAGLLGAFHTSFASFPGTALNNLGRLPLFLEINKRNFDKKLQPYTHTSPYKEIGRLLASKMGWTDFLTHESGRYSVDQVYQYIDRQTAKLLVKQQKNGIKGVYAYEDGAVETFRQASLLGLKCLYDLPIGYWRAARRLLQEEIDARPEWAATMTGFKDSIQKLNRKDEEILFANHIFVASSFTAGTLNDFPNTLPPISVIPYGFPSVAARTYSVLANRPLKLLFVGGLSQRKGIANVLEAAAFFKHHVELTIVGRKPVNDCTILNKSLTKHRYIPALPHHEILQLMRSHDLLLFPSLFEGFGLVITEAMSQGTPVITTDRTIGPDVIEHKQNGWIIKAGCSTSLCNQIDEILSSPSAIMHAGNEALHKAKTRPWKQYATELTDKISEILNTK